MYSLTLSKPNFVQNLYNKWRYRDSIAKCRNLPALAPEQAQWLTHLRQDGTIQIDNFVAPAMLLRMQEELQLALEELDFQMPCLAQSRIDVNAHKDLIDANLYASTEEFKRRGMAFSDHEVSSLDQAVTEFQPLTLTSYMLKRSEIYRSVWLDPRLLSCVTAYLGLTPTLVEAYVRRNFPGPHRTMNHFWHRDLNNPHYLVKAFLFLSDCTIDNGPHEFIRGTHTNFDVLNGQRYFNDEQVNASFPSDCADRMVSEVKAGTLIIEDTRGLHRARMPVQGYRDLGYAVFTPLTRKQQAKVKYYEFPKDAIAGLSPFQRSFIPDSVIK